MNMSEELGRRFARLTTNAVLRAPALWRLLRWPLGFQFDRLASRWESMRDELSLAPLEAALSAVAPAPTRALDLGTGTGAAARTIAARWPQAEVVGVDIAQRMLEEAERLLPPELRGRVRFQVADASQLPFGDGSFDLVVHANMIPFFEEVARVVRPGGSVVFAFSGGDQTPIYVEPARLRTELVRRGFSDFADFSAGRGTALLARKAERA
jgi:ubiquinone/menaquinone biosynthesis C-methylase UbiE